MNTPVTACSAPGWRFSHSFPSTSSAGGRTPLFDHLQDIGAITDVVLSALDDGYDVVARLDPTHLTGALAAIAGCEPLRLRGRVVPSGAEDAGIEVTTALPDADLGGIALEGGQLRLVGPLDGSEEESPRQPAEWSGRLRIGGLLFNARAEVGLSSPFFAADASPRLDVVDLDSRIGQPGLVDLLPAELSALVVPDGGATVESVVVRGLVGVRGLDIDLLAITLTTSGAAWTVVEDLLVVDELAVTVAVTAPFATTGRRIGITIGGDVTIAGVPCSVTCALPSGLVAARLRPGASLPLGQLLGELAPGLPVPADLTVTALELNSVLGTAGSFGVRAMLRDDGGGLAIRLGHRAIAVSGLSVRVAMDPRGPSGELTGWVGIAGTDLFCTARHDGRRWEFTGGLAPGEVLPLGAIVADLLPADVDLPEAVASIDVTDLWVRHVPATGDYAVSGRLSTEWDLDLGPLRRTVALELDVRGTTDPGTGRRATLGRLAGTLALGDTTFGISYEFAPGTDVVRGVAESGATLEIGALADALGLGVPDLDLPDILPELQLTAVGFSVERRPGAGVGAVFSGRSATLGQVAVAVRRGAAGWGFVLSAMVKTAHLDALPGDIGAALAELDWLPVDQVVLLLSSTTYQRLDATTVAALGPHTLDVRPGLELILTVDIGDTAADLPVTLSNLRTIARRDALVLRMALRRPLSASALEMDLDGSVAIGPPDAQLVLSDARIVLAIAAATVAIAGTVAFEIDGQRIEAIGRVAIGIDGISAALNVRSDQALFHPLGFKGVHLLEIGAMLDVGFRPPQLGFGLAGRFVIGDPPALPPPSAGAQPLPAKVSLTERPLDNRFALVLAVTATTVIPQLLSLYLQEISLPALLRAVLDEEVELPDVLDGIRATDVLLYWCEAVTMLPDGTMTTPGIGFNADLDLWGLHAHAGLQIDSAAGIRGDARIDPIHIDGVLDLTGTEPPPGNTDAAAGGRGRVVPGGAYVHITTAASPYLALSWHAVLFSTLHQDIEVLVTSAGFSFELDAAVGAPDAAPLFASSLSCTLTGLTHLNVRFAVDLDLDLDLSDLLGLDLGRFHLLSAAAAVELDVRVGETVAITLDASFSVEDVSLTMPQLAVSVVPRSIAELPDLVAGQIADTAGDVLDVVLGGLREPARWAMAVRDGLVTAVDDVATTLKNVFDCTAAEAAAALNAAQWAADEVAEGLRDVYELGSAVALTVLTGAGYAAEAVTRAMADVFDWSEEVLDAAGEAFTDLGRHVADFAGERDVAMVVFNLTAHRLQVIGSHGTEITPGTAMVIEPGEAGVVGRFAASTGRWGWVYLRDVDTGSDYQLYIQMSSVVGNTYTSFDHRNPQPHEENAGSHGLPGWSARSVWSGADVAAYTFARTPDDPPGQFFVLRDRSHGLAITAGATFDGHVYHADPGTPPDDDVARWRLMELPGDFFQIIDHRHDKALMAGDTYDGHVYHGDPNDGAHAQWRVLPGSSPGAFVIVDRKHGKAIVAGDTADGHLYHQDPRDRANAAWQAAAVDGDLGSSPFAPEPFAGEH